MNTLYSTSYIIEGALIDILSHLMGDYNDDNSLISDYLASKYPGNAERKFDAFGEKVNTIDDLYDIMAKYLRPPANQFECRIIKD